MVSLGRRVGSPPPPDGQRAEEIGLAGAIARGDTDAFNTFYERYVDRLYRMIYYQLNAQQADAEDVLQETMMAAVKALPSFRGDARLFTWLCGIAQHKITDHRRHQGADGEKVTVPLEDDRLWSSDGADHAQSTETRVVLRQALAAMPEDYRQVLLLKYVQGLSVDEIAKVMGRSFKSVESLLSRARESLRLTLERETMNVA